MLYQFEVDTSQYSFKAQKSEVQCTKETKNKIGIYGFMMVQNEDLTERDFKYGHSYITSISLFDNHNRVFLWLKENFSDYLDRENSIPRKSLPSTIQPNQREILDMVEL